MKYYFNYDVESFQVNVNPKYQIKELDAFHNS